MAAGELMELLLPVVRADLALCEMHLHIPSPPLGCPISAYGGTHDPKVSREDLEPWREHTRGAFSVTMFLGDHFVLHQVEELLLRRLSRALDALA